MTTKESFSYSAHVGQRRRVALILILSGCAVVLVVVFFVAQWIYTEHRRASEAATLEAELASLRPSSTPVFPFRFNQSFEPLLVTLAASQTTERTPEQLEAPLWELHESVVTHVARRLELPEEAREIVVRRARDRHKAMVDLYYREFHNAISQETAIPDAEGAFSFRLASAARDFSRILSQQLCGYTLSALHAEIDIPGAKAVLAVPCEVILTEVLLPITEEMESQGLLLDYVNGRETIENQLQRAILELGTAETEFDDQVSLEYSKKLYFDWAVSRGNLRISAHPRVKAGFDLLQYFSYQVDGAREELIVTLPPPKILSVTPNLRIDQLREGFLVNIDEAKVNEAIAIIEASARQRAIDSGLLEVARANAQATVRQLLLPLARSPLGVYGVRVEFADRTDKLVISDAEKGL